MNSSRTTQEIIADSKDCSIIARRSANPKISTRSHWLDDRWFLDNLTPGVRNSKCRVTWAVLLPQGEFLTDDKYSALLDTLRVFTWTLFTDPRDGMPLKAATAPIISLGLQHLVQWMLSRDYESLEELDAESSKIFLEDLVEELSAVDWDNADIDEIESEADPAEDELTALSFNAVWNRVRIWILLWRQSRALSDAGLKPIAAEPFGGRSAKNICDEVAERVMAKVQPFPDEVAIPIMTAAHRLIDVPAEDVIRLQEAVTASRDESERQGLSIVKKNLKTRLVITNYRFSTISGESAPWCDSILQRGVNENYQSVQGSATVLDVLRGLVDDIRDACTIIIQSQAGLRINEVCGLKAGIDPLSGLPSCIEVRRSLTGLNELFYLKGLLSKVTRAPIEVEWLVGSRPYGTSLLPAPVRAILVLDRLHRPWRAIAADSRLQNALIISMEHGRGLPRRSSTIGPISTERLLAGQRSFVKTYVNLAELPDRGQNGEDLSGYRTSLGGCIRTHQWRKTYALYVYRTDNRLIDAIAQQFHHVSLAMTEQGYIGNDPTLLDAFDSVRTQRTTEFFYEMARGVKPVAGRAAKIIESHIEEMQKLIAGRSVADGKREIERWCSAVDLRIYFAGHGKCLMAISPSSARCHEVAGTSHWSNKEPNYSVREPSMCVGCKLFAVDAEHSSFWLKRYRDNKSAFLDAKRQGRDSDYQIANERASQAASILSVLRIGLPNIAV